MTGKELSAILAECAARTEIARAGVEEARRKQEAAVAKQEAAIAKQEGAIAKQEAATAEQKALTMKLDEQRAAADARWEEERVAMRQYLDESARKTDVIVAELREARDERRAILEALFRVMDRLPPPPPNLRSA